MGAEGFILARRREMIAPRGKAVELPCGAGAVTGPGGPSICRSELRNTSIRAASRTELEAAERDPCSRPAVRHGLFHSMDNLSTLHIPPLKSAVLCRAQAAVYSSNRSAAFAKLKCQSQ